MRIEKKGKAEALIAELRENLVRLTAQARDIGTGQKDKRKLNAEIGALNAELNALIVDLDSIRRRIRCLIQGTHEPSACLLH